MSDILILSFLFAMGSLLGWCLEVVYRRFSPANKSRRWINPGFMTGPYLPIYGFGLIALYLMAGLEETDFIGNAQAGGKAVLFIAMAAVMTLIEYVAGLIFIKGMKVQLWDYSGERFNVQGIICLRFSIYWAMLGAMYYFLIHPHILDAVRWLSENITFSFFIGMFYGVFMVDLIRSLGIVTKVRTFARENEILIKYEELKMQIRQNAAERMQKPPWLLQFRSDIPIKEHLSRYFDLHQAFFKADMENRFKKKK
ncbi:MAG: putative ABC transporter permease [Anaerovoracaceae bacterium]